MTCQFQLLHRAVGSLDPQVEGRELKANALVVQRPSGLPGAYEVMYAPVKLKELSTGMYVGQTPHGEIRLRLTGLYGARRLIPETQRSYVVLMGASGRTARIDEMPRS